MAKIKTKAILSVGRKRRRSALTEPRKSMKPIVTIRGPFPQWVGDIFADEFTKIFADEFTKIFTEGLVDEPPRVRDFHFRRAAPRGPFLWLSHGGELLDPRDMATPHLYYALRMIFNHSVPEEFRTPESLHPLKKYADVPSWSPSYRQAAINALSNELRTRDPAGLTPAMQDGLRWMAMAARAILNEGI